MATAEEVKEIRNLFEVGISQAWEIARMAEEDPRFGGDVALAAAYVHSAGLAIQVKSDRDAWNLKHARSVKATWIENVPGIAAYVAAREVKP